MYTIFQCIFTFAEYPMTWLESGVQWAGDHIAAAMAPGDLRDLLVNGVVAGVGGVVVFLPQILMLFLFIGLLEDTGYMARAAFLMDRLMSRVGLHGKSFIPMLSSFACADPRASWRRARLKSPKGPARHHSCRAADELLSALAGLHLAHRGVHSGSRARQSELQNSTSASPSSTSSVSSVCAA